MRSIGRSGWVVYGALYALGLMHWIWFLNFGEIDFRCFDWFKEYAYYGALREALQSGSVPWHIAAAFQGTNKFLTIPETLISPQIVALPFVSTGVFVLLNTCFLYSLGFVGCIALQRRHALSVISLCFLATTYLTNGYITSHLAAGHSMWNGYFLLPFFWLFLLDLRRTQTAALALSMVLYLMILQGSFHIVLWCWGLLVATAVFNWPLARRIFLVLALSGGMSLGRIAPAMAFLHAANRYVAPGYSSLGEAIDATASARDYNFKVPNHGYGWWEFDQYVTPYGVALIAIGVATVIARHVRRSAPTEPRLLFPIGCVLALAFGTNQEALGRFFPISTVEGVPTRFLIIPIQAFILFGIVMLDGCLGRRPRAQALRLIVFIGWAHHTVLMARHSQLWSFGRLAQDESTHWAAAREVGLVVASAPSYKRLVALAWAASGLVVVTWLTLFLRTRRHLPSLLERRSVPLERAAQASSGGATSG
jgi:hypothetical protein